MDITREPISMDELNEAHREVNGGVYTSTGQEVKVVDYIKIEGEEPDTITQVFRKNGGIDRNFYGDDGRQVKQISNYDHGHKSEQTFGEHGEHVHDYVWNKDGTVTHKEARELTDKERKDNGDMI